MPESPPKFFSGFHHSCKAACLCLLLGLWLWSFAAFAQQEDQGVMVGVGDGRPLTPSEGDPNSLGVVSPQILRETPGPYGSIFNTVRFSGADQLRFGDSYTSGANLGANFSSTKLNLPFIQRRAPMDYPTLMAGPFYAKVVFLTGTALFSDNTYLTTSNPQSGGAAIIRMGLLGMLQMTETLQLSVAGTVVYLPFQNQIGIAGFGIGDIFADFSTMAQANLVYNASIDRWDFQVYDAFSVFRQSLLSYENSTFRGEVFTEQDQAGRYFLRDSTPLTSGVSNRNSLYQSAFDFFEVRNAVGASVSRLVPTETEISSGVEHDNYWYLNSDRVGGLPSSQDLFYVGADSQRENMRFRPFAEFRGYRYNFQDNFNYYSYAGFRGPATENLFLFGEGGYAWSENDISSSPLAVGSATHYLSPYTAQLLEYRQWVTLPVSTVERTTLYNIQQVLGPYLVGSAFAAHSTFDPLERGALGSSENRFGGLLTADVGLYTTLRALVTYSEINFNDAQDNRMKIWRPRADLIYRVHPAIDLILTYQYQDVSSTVFNGSYRENLVMLTVAKYF